MKTNIYYDEMCLPASIRIKSETLCLDYTFNPAATQKTITYEGLKSIIENPMTDLVQIEFASETGYIKDYEGNINPVLGWLQIKPAMINLLKVSEINDF